MSLLAIAFRSGQPYDADVPFPGEDASAFVAEQDGKLAGGFRIRHMTVTCREALLRCGGISSVAVAPEYRQRGVGSAMMTWALARMCARGWQVTALHAFRESYYRRFGWECAGRRVQLTCPQWRFPRLTCGLPVQQVRLEDWAAWSRHTAHLPWTFWHGSAPESAVVADYHEQWQSTARLCGW
jgi:GNAT superfamily N-acetyltransferase